MPAEGRGLSLRGPEEGGRDERGRPAACAAVPFCRGCSASSTVATLPLRLISVDTRLLSAALFAGPQPVRIWLLSSSKIKSPEHWFPFSALQRPQVQRQQPARRRLVRR